MCVLVSTGSFAQEPVAEESGGALTAPTDATDSQVPQPPTSAWRGLAPAGPAPIRLTQVPSTSRWAASRPQGHRLVVDALPFVSEVAAGVLGLVDYTYRAPNGFWLRARVGPAGFAVAGGDRIGVFDSAALAGWDQRWFALGVGAGVGYVRVEDSLRRTHGLTGIGLFSLRGGTQDGFHVAMTFGGTIVDGEMVPTSAVLNVRVPLSHGRLIDVELSAAPPLAMVYAVVAMEMNLRRNPDSPWRIRPHAGLVEVIDPVGRDGGGGFTLGVALVYQSGQRAVR